MQEESRECKECKIVRDIGRVAELKKQNRALSGARVLATLQGLEPVSQQNLANILKIRLQSLVQTLGSLEKREYIQRVRNEADKREMLVVITERGNEALAGHESFSEFCSRILKPLEEEEKETLLILLEKILKENEDE